VVYKQTEAIKRAKARLGKAYPAGWCQKWVVTEVFASGGVGDFDGDRAADAEDGWKAAKKKVAVTSGHASSIPAGYPIYFTGGRSDHGHAAVSAGNGQMYSTDLNAGKTRYGRIGLTPIRTAEIAWGVKLVGYVITDGNGNTFTDPASTPKPAPVPKLVRHFEHRHLNTWGDDGAEGTTSFFQRVDAMTKDLLSGTRPDVITLNEVQADDVASWTKRLNAEGYDVALAEAGNLVAVPRGTEIRKAQSKYLPSSIQGAGRREALGMVRAKINGHWEHIFVSHLDYRNGAKYDALRVRQAEWIGSEAKRWSATFVLKNWRTHTTIGLDENSHTWVRDKGLVPAGFDVAAKSGIDAIYGNRPTIASSTIATKSDHPIMRVVYGKAA
jgi:hypothetical protein